MQHTFFVHFFTVFPRLQRETSITFLYTVYGGNVVCVPLHIYFIILFYFINFALKNTTKKQQQKTTVDMQTTYSGRGTATAKANYCGPKKFKDIKVAN